MQYPLHSLYETLYARYLTPKRTAQLLDLCGELHGKRLLDLCGGGGRASLQALVRGAKDVTLVDESVEMTHHLAGIDKLRLVLLDVDSALLPGVLQGPFDAAVCQQAITYWFRPELVPALHKALTQKGVLVFNSFNEPPPALPVPKQYEFAGRRYLELSWRSDETTVEHVQICEGLAPHTTCFQWISPEAFQTALASHFDVEELRDGKTSVFRCVAKDVPRRAG